MLIPLFYSDELFRGGSAFISEVRRAGLQISGKSVLLCTSKKLAKQIIAASERKHVEISWVQEAEHLGLGRSTHRGRVFAAIAKRFKKAKKRAG